MTLRLSIFLAALGLILQLWLFVTDLCYVWSQLMLILQENSKIGILSVQ
jgi:hypothetical protein